MADPQAALLTQVRNIQSKTGRALADLHAEVEASGLLKHGERRSLLMERYGLGYGDANTVVALLGKSVAGLGGATPAAPAPTGDPLAEIYTGAKAALRPLHEKVMAVVAGFGPFEQAPKKTYISLRRRKQFATVGPATRELIEIGLNDKALPLHPRLKALPAGSMCTHRVRLGTPAEIDAELSGWLRAAYDAAG